MRIGILTLPLHVNYGGILQAYALQTVLERMGHEVQVIGKDNIKDLPPFYKYIERGFNKFILKKNVHIFAERDSNHYLTAICGEIQNFIDRHIHTFHVTSLDAISSSNFDAIVVGSDQIWRRFYFHIEYQRGMEDAFLFFSKDWSIKRVAYAASFGIDEWDYDEEETRKCTEMARTFKAIGVREKSAVELCQKHLSCKATHVLDPTMLLDKEDYIKLINSQNIPQSDGDLLCYILDATSEKTAIVKQIVQEEKIRPFSVIANEDHEVKPSVEFWLKGFSDAKFVVTDSFHACVFSLIFNKPFVVIGNKERGLARIYSLLQMFGQEHRLILDKNKVDISKDLRKAPNVDLSLFQNESYHFLEQSLNS